MVNYKLNVNIQYGMQMITSSSMSDSDKPNEDGTIGNIKLETKPKTKIPALYRVLMMNDDYTPMEFVIEVLEKFFSKK
jgi:ATP-dependent Clp protease adaptor protein ClpS